MREIVIRMFDALVLVLMILMVAGTLVLSVLRYNSEGAVVGVVTFCFGFVITLLVGGVLFTIVNIHDNSKRSADALEKLTKRLGGSE
ncbi:MAG: hypothetical protein AAFQ36_08040 [Pseudomonadota bacterium]